MIDPRRTSTYERPFTREGNYLVQYLYCRISHATSAIIKPQQKIDSVGAREIEEAMKKVKEAQSLITAAIDPGNSPLLIRIAT